MRGGYKMADTGIFGGTFNPVHNGHLRLAEAAREQFHLRTVLFVPARVPPHKKYFREISDADRIRLLRLGIEGNPGFAFDDLELQREGLSFSIDTVSNLKNRCPDDCFYFIIGEDNLPGLNSWKEFERLREMVVFLVAPRSVPSRTLREQVQMADCDCRVIETEPLAIASSDIRKRIADGKSIRYLVPDPVRKYAAQKGLYK